MRFEHLNDAIAWRRSLHRCPQPAWLEFYATAFVAEKLANWGYELSMGRDIIKEGEQLLLPAPEVLQAEFDRAVAAGAKLEFLEPVKIRLSDICLKIRNTAILSVTQLVHHE